MVMRISEKLCKFSPQNAMNYLFSEQDGTGSLFTRHGLFLKCLLNVESNCEYVMLKELCFHFRTTTFFNFQRTYEKKTMSSEKWPGPILFREHFMDHSPTVFLYSHTSTKFCLYKPYDATDDRRDTIILTQLCLPNFTFTMGHCVNACLP